MYTTCLFVRRLYASSLGVPTPFYVLAQRVLLISARNNLRVWMSSVLHGSRGDVLKTPKYSSLESLRTHAAQHCPSPLQICRGSPGIHEVPVT